MTAHSQAWSCSAPAAVGAYLDAQHRTVDFARWVNIEAQKLGKNTGALRRGGPEGYVTIGLAPVDRLDPPEGWKYSSRAQAFVPATGRAGRHAQEWLAAHQPPPAANIRTALTEHGLPPNDLTKPGVVATPTVGQNSGVLWALYEGEPGDWMSGPQTPGEGWVKRTVAEYWAAAAARLAVIAKAG